jgi:fatty acid synthase subunit alpha
MVSVVVAVRVLPSGPMVLTVNLRIATQDALFGQQNTKRVIEIGASDILGTMARRTLASKYRASDASRSIRRQVLTFAEDEKEISYEVQAVKEEALNDASIKPPPAQTMPVHASTRAAITAAPVAAQTTAAKLIADTPLMAIMTIRTLIAHKTKKSFLDISLGRSIKEIVGGECPVATLTHFPPFIE